MRQQTRSLADFAAGWITFAAVVAILMGSFFQPAAAKENAEIAFQKIDQSVGALYARNFGGAMNFLCSATAIDHHDGKTVILTANHCLKKGVAYFINFGDGQMRPLTVWKIPHYEADPKGSPKKYGEPETDMALFLMEGTGVPLIEIAADSSEMVPGREVAMVGYPLGIAKISYVGNVAGRFDLVGHDLHGYVLMQIFGASGSSGSSVVDIETGKVVAIMVAVTNSRVGLPVVFATPIEYTRHLSPVREE